MNDLESLQNIKLKYPNNIFIGHLNINSLRNKITLITPFIQRKLDIFFITETKIDESFPDAQFQIPFYKMFRKDRNKKGGGIILYVNEEILCKKIDMKVDNHNIEAIFIEVNLRKEKWLMIGVYKPPSQSECDFVNTLQQSLSSLSQKYERFIIIGDLNMKIENEHLSSLIENFDLHSLISKPTCYKNKDNPSCIDLILTSHKNSFFHSDTVETGISDFHKLVVTIMRSHKTKTLPKTKIYRNYKNFDNTLFENELLAMTANVCDLDQYMFEFQNILDKHAPKKRKILRGNNKPFMNKRFRKMIMNRSKLKNKFNETKNENDWKEYKKQRNLCTNELKKVKKNYFQSLNVNDVTDNKTFWNTVKLLISNTTNTTHKIILCEDNKILNDDTNIASLMNDYFTNITKKLNLKPANAEETSNVKSVIKNIVDKYKNHISIRKINEQKYNTEFKFEVISENEVIKELNHLSCKKASVSNDIPAFILKNSKNLIASKVAELFNDSIKRNAFPSSLKIAEITPVLKKMIQLRKKTIGQ